MHIFARMHYNYKNCLTFKLIEQLVGHPYIENMSFAFLQHCVIEART